MKKSKKFLALALATVMAASLTACGGKTDNKTSGSTPKSSQSASTGSQTASTGSDSGEKVKAELTVWSPQEDQSEESGNWLGKMCDNFAKAHPEWEITFKYGTCSEGDANKTVTQDPKTAADVYMYANDQVGDLLAAKAIAKFGGETLEKIKSENSQTMVDTVTYQDGIYGIPFSANTWFMYYDKRVFSEDDVKSLETMLEKGKVSFPLSNSWYTAAFYVANGCNLFGGNNDEAAGIDFSGDKAVAVTNYLVDLVANKNFSNDDSGSGLAGLADGSVNAIFSGTWDYNAVVEALGGEENVGATQLPTIKIDGKDCQLKSFAGSKAIAVNPNSANPQVAVALAAYLGSAEAQKEHYNLRKIIPVNETILADPAVAADTLVKAQGSAIANSSIMQPFTAGMGSYWDNTVTMAKAILSKEVTHENAAEKTEAYNNALNGK